MPDQKYRPSIFVGAEKGLLKSIDLGKRNATNHYGSSRKINLGPNDLAADQSIQQMSLLPENRLLVAMENAQAKIFDSSEKTFENPVSLKNPTEEGKTWAGFGLAEDTIVGAGSDGVVHTWSLEKLSDLSNMEMKELLDPVAQTKVKIGPNGKLRCGKVRKRTMIVGGEESQIQMLDLENLDKGPVFSSKSVRPDKLQLHIPEWINFPAIALPESSETIACSSYGSLINQSHEFRLYDPRAVQRRPVKRVEWGNHPITSLLPLDDTGNIFVLGNARGKIGMLDLRNPKKMRSFKGAAGSIRDMCRHPDDTTKFGAVGLDRHLHIYDIKTCKKIHKVYLKSELNCVLMESGSALQKEDENKKSKKIENSKMTTEIMQEEKDTWNEMDNLESVLED